MSYNIEERLNYYRSFCDDLDPKIFVELVGLIQKITQPDIGS